MYIVFFIRLLMQFQDSSPILIYIVLTLQSFIFCITSYFNRELEKRNQFIWKKKIENETKSTSDVLSLLVPKFIKNQMNQGSEAIQEE